MKKILFLHGFYASGQCVPAVALREAFAGRADNVFLLLRYVKHSQGVPMF